MSHQLRKRIESLNKNIEKKLLLIEFKRQAIKNLEQELLEYEQRKSEREAYTKIKKYLAKLPKGVNSGIDTAVKYIMGNKDMFISTLKNKIKLTDKEIDILYRKFKDKVS